MVPDHVEGLENKGYRIYCDNFYTSPALFHELKRKGFANPMLLDCHLRQIQGIKWKKSPRGLNAHLNWRKLPVVHLGVCHPLEKLWGPSPGPPWGHVYHLNNSESPTPKDVFWIRWKLLFRPPPRTHYTPPPPPPGPIGATLGTAMNNFNSSHKKVFEYYITWLFYFWIWRRCYFEICMVLALASPLPGPPCTIWTTLNTRPLRMIPAKFA